jgi:hypothetical protein
MAARKKPNVAFEEECRKALLAVAGSYAKARKLSLSTVSRDFYGHAGFFKNFAKRGVDGRTITVARMQTLLGQFADRWPEGLAWPQMPPVFVPTKVGGHAEKPVNGAQKNGDGNPR